jgi:hypothetical protein
MLQTRRKPLPTRIRPHMAQLARARPPGETKAIGGEAAVGPTRWMFAAERSAETQKDLVDARRENQGTP